MTTDVKKKSLNSRIRTNNSENNAKLYGARKYFLEIILLRQVST
jgi:hypothetical protein